jgi:multisubunit Na+/H+ antiporter MnhB subunit
MTATVLTQTVARLVLAPVLVIAVAILVNGYAQVGDGFSAGVIAALGLLLQYLAFGREEAERLLRLRYLPAAALVALLAALALALAPMLRGDPLFTHYPRAGADVVEIGRLEAITAVAFDVAVFVLVVGAVVGIVHAVARAGEEAAR